MFFQIFGKQPKIRRLTVYLDKITYNSWEELENEFGKISGVTAPGLDVPTQIFRVDYEPKYISKENVLKKLTDLGYSYSNVEDRKESPFSFK